MVESNNIDEIDNNQNYSQNHKVIYLKYKKKNLFNWHKRIDKDDV